MIRWLRGLPERVPLRVTLVAAMLLLLTLALAASGGAGTWALRGYLTERVDSQLAVFTGSFLDAAARDERSAIVVGTTRSVSFYLLIADNDGLSVREELHGPTNGQGQPRLPTLDRERAERRAGKPFTTPAVGVRDQRWRVLVNHLPDGSGSITVAMSLNEVDETVGNFAAAYTLFGAVVLAVLAVIGYIIVRRSLRRLIEVERTAREIAAGDLTQRVPPGHPETEVGRLAAAFNTMLGEIESAFRAREQSEREARASEARMRRFAADASHELRTPLTAIRGFAELYRQSGAEPEHLIGRIEHHSTRMSLLVEDLLLLARLDQQRPLEHRPVDLLALAADVVQDVAATVEDHPVRLQAFTDPEHPPVVLGDELRLRQVVGNLLSNAVVHTPAGTHVVVTVDIRDGAAVLEVADGGPGLAPEDAARVFERFFRTDPARSRVAGGSGLGLSIVDALVRAHGGDISLDTAPGSGARFVVRLPLYTPEPVAAPELTADQTVAEPAGS